MKIRYVIGFFIFVLLFVILLNYGFYKTYQISRNEENLQQNENATEIPNIPTDGQAKKENSYYLKSENNYVIVYYSDQKTIFQYTTIRLDMLPKHMKQELEEGKWIRNTKELYSFLENYSS